MPIDNPSILSINNNRSVVVDFGPYKFCPRVFISPVTSFSAVHSPISEVGKAFLNNGRKDGCAKTGICSIHIVTQIFKKPCNVVGRFRFRGIS